jgi:hypothetical protein
MYLLKIETDERAYRHIVARVEWPRLSAGTNGDPQRSLFLDYFCQVSPLWMQLPVLSASLRIDVSPDGVPVTWHGFTIDVADGETIRRAVAALIRLDGVEDGTVAAPGGLADFEERYAGATPQWLTLDGSPMTTSVGGEFFSPVRIFDSLPTLLSSAVAMGHALSYQATLRPGRPDPELIRRARKATAFLERERGVPRRLLSAQASTVERLEESRMVAEEAVAIAPAGRNWLTGWLRDHSGALDGEGSNPVRAPVPLDEDTAYAFATHIHPDLLLPPRDPADPALIGRYWNAADAMRLFRCESLWRSGAQQGEPPVSPLPMFFGGNGGGRPSGGPGVAAPPHNGADDFFFVSYAHKDIGAIRPILDKLTSDGVRIWIDTQIQVGEEWDTRLETMITTSAGVLVFLSPHYVASKHCRRELKFADSLDKDILASAIDDFPRQEGLGYIFASLQYATGPHDKIADALAVRLRARADTGRQ